MTDALQLGVLALEDGSVFRGRAFGATTTAVGEAVFNTSMTGYQETITDPSYYGQIVTMTAPQIGNYGISLDDNESDRPQVFGFVVREMSRVASNWRSSETLDGWLKAHGVPGLSGVDTRAITKRLRVHGALKACLSTEDISDEEAVKRAREWVGIVGADYVREVTTKEAFDWNGRQMDARPFTVPGTQLVAPSMEGRKRYKVVAFDLGAKYNIFRKLAYHGFDVTVVPATTSFEEVRDLAPDGVFLSNGPGDPAPLDYVHQAVAKIIQEYPTFGICMGNQILTHALGGKTYKLKFGHRGANQPVKNLETGKVSITSQNHGFAASPQDVEQRGAVVTEINLNDGTVEGLRHKDLPCFSVQYHPEASPGPHDSDPLFDEFHTLVAKTKGDA
ncbi:MAG: carbamoyl-phosphate synthase small subunit [Puniceicoccaceae bacterium 5H]|nr:MAG: carbamoyl-phosphate synthase small subunit [Puniceicoccaceae bacterium 5H]